MDDQGEVGKQGNVQQTKGKRERNYRVKVEEVAKAFCVALFLLTWMSGTSTHAKVLQSSPILCDPIDCSLSGSSVPGILQARILE